MKSILIALVFICSGISAAEAGVCKAAYLEAKALEKIVEEVYFVSEGDDTWHAFASWTTVKEVSESEIRRVLNLPKVLGPDHWNEGEPAHFSMSKDHSELYSFIRGEIEVYEDTDAYDDPEAAAKLKRLISRISKKFGKNARLFLYGAGDGDSFFSGDHMIVLIDHKGCVLGLKADTAWT